MCVCVDRYVILGGHRDAWVFGGIDPVTGAAATHETVRAAGKLLQKGNTHTDTQTELVISGSEIHFPFMLEITNNTVCACVCVRLAAQTHSDLC